MRLSPAARRRLADLRLSAQLLGSRVAQSPAEAVRWMLGLQAQDLPGVLWSVGLRSAATEAEVRAAFDAGEIVRSWPLRGTLHLVAAEDLHWMLELTTPRAIASESQRRRQLGITDPDIERARETAVASLPGRSALSRDALLAAIAAGGVSTDGARGYHLLWFLAQTGTLVLGASHGRGQTFARLDAWVTRPRRLEKDEALGELASRYVRGHGPASVEDLARWSGLAVRDVRRGIAVAGDRLVEIELDGRSFLLDRAAADDDGRGDPVLFLPGFDEYLLGYRDRSAVLAPEHANAIVPGGNGVFRPTVVVGGEVVGTWSRTVRPREVVVEAAFFDGGPADEPRDLGQAALRYERFLERPVRVAARR